MQRLSSDYTAHCLGHPIINVSAPPYRRVLTRCLRMTPSSKFSSFFKLWLQVQLVVHQLLTKAGSFSAQDLANMLGSFARLGFRPSEERMKQILSLVSVMLVRSRSAVWCVC